MALPLLAGFALRGLGGFLARSAMMNAAQGMFSSRGGVVIDLKVHGLPELRRALNDVPKQLRNRILRDALRSGGNMIRDEARSRVPVLKSPKPNRRSGTIKRNIVVRTSKFARRNKDVGVFVSVRPLRGSRTKKMGMAGANNPNDPFYWWFVEWGTRSRTIKPVFKRALKIGEKGFAANVKHPGSRPALFMTRAADQLPRAATMIIRKAVPAINALNNRSRRRIYD